jgi:hypothetical protein
MTRKSDLEAAKERRRARLRAYSAKRYADQNFALGRKSMCATDKLKSEPIPNGTPSTKKQRRYYRTTGKFLPSRKRSRQRAYAKLAANSEWRGREKYAFLFSIALEAAAMFAMMIAPRARPPIAEPPRLVVNNYPP